MLNITWCIRIRNEYAGEIFSLSKLVKPHIGIITNGVGSLKILKTLKE